MPRKEKIDKTQKNGIENYFKSKISEKKGSTQEEEGKENEHEQQEKEGEKKNNFYEKCLEMEIEMPKCTTGCLEKKKGLKLKISELNEKIEKLEDAIKTCQSIISEKDLNIVKLQEESTQRENREEPIEPERMYESFSNEYFNREELIHLKSIAKTKSGDSSFIHFVIKCLYSTNLESVRNKTACDRSCKNSEKVMMTPEKKKVTAEIYKERLCHIEKNVEERYAREKKLNKLIKDAFMNITKSLQKKEIKEDTLRKLHQENVK